ncbi:hypothetical protein MUB04_15140 [Acinetobacter indicus]|uniref:hypothetical protein n=1 Tax=Acinetobacter TaxID=469 RepID=UPI0015D1083E|nr:MULTISPECIES: hypothetical protein [Acinetobacter]MCP0917870.1 hypothetical protein [Acinetobacter indicus]
MKLTKPNSIFLNFNELHGVPESQHINFARSIPLPLAQKTETVNLGQTRIDYSICMVYEPNSAHVLGLLVNAGINCSYERGTTGTDFNFVLPEACFYGPASFRKALMAMLWRLQEHLIIHLDDTLIDGISNAERIEVLSYNEDEAINEDNPLFHTPGIIGANAFSHSYAALSKLAESIISVAGEFLMDNDVHTGIILTNGVKEYARLPSVTSEHSKIYLSF